MENQASRRRQHFWLLLALMSGSLGIAVPSQAGTVPTGQASGVTVGGSTILPTGASSLGREPYLESTSPNAAVDPFTGDVSLATGAQQTLNASASQILQGLQSTNPALFAILSTPGEIALSGLSAAGPTGEGEGEANTAAQTVEEVAAAAAAAIANGESVALLSSQGTFSIAAPTAVAGALPPILATSAVFTPAGGTPMVMPLRGTLDQIANAAGFLAASFAADIPPTQAATFTEMALVGADYVNLITLFNAVSGLLPTQPQTQGPVATSVNATQLEAAIQAYNRILDSTDPAALVTLSQFEDFVALGRSLQQLRAAIDVETALE